MKKTTETRSWLRAADVIPCPAWCDCVHSPDATSENRKHFSKKTLAFDLLLAEPRLSAGVELAAAELHVGMEQGFREVGPRISIWSDFKSDAVDLELTVTEAEQVGRMLLKLAKQARKAEGTGR